RSASAFCSCSAYADRPNSARASRSSDFRFRSCTCSWPILAVSWVFSATVEATSVACCLILSRNPTCTPLRFSSRTMRRMHPRCVHHIGHAVHDLDAAIDTYTTLLGATVEHRQTVPEQGVEAVTLRVADGRIELLRALGPDTPVGRFLNKRGP